MTAATTSNINQVIILTGLVGGHVKSDRLRAHGAEARHASRRAEARARRRYLV